MKELTGGAGVDVVMDVVGGDVFTDSLRSLAPQGRAARGRLRRRQGIPEVKVNRLLLNNIDVRGVGVGHLEDDALLTPDPPAPWRGLEAQLRQRGHRVDPARLAHVVADEEHLGPECAGAAHLDPEGAVELVEDHRAAIDLPATGGHPRDARGA